MPARTRGWARGLGLGLAFGVGAVFAGARPASAQFPAVGTGFGSPPGAAAAMSGNPFLSPYGNPFLNPALTQQSMTPGSAGLYFFAAQQATGGIGSGRLSGSRPLPGSPAGLPAAGRNAATDPAPRGLSNRPGAGAARYFAREFPAKAEPKGYYKRQVRQFPSIGR